MLHLNKSQSSALETVLSGHNVLIAGTAGTGKSFLIGEIVKECQKKGKTVALTCTTGIACCVYQDMCLHASTLHRWSGIEDGRHSPSEIKTVILNNVKYAHVVENVRKTDILIIDEVSMLSKKVFESLCEVCAIKNEKYAFGGMQLVFCGDFYQLPPVSNAMYNEEGKYCFESDLFLKLLSHRIILDEVVRQKDKEFIKVIKETCAGSVSQTSIDFIKTLDRPLNINNDFDSVKLFSTNDLVDDFNRNELLKMNGPVYEYISTDMGKINYLNHVLAPHKLWLKVGAPVILLRNLSNKLVNGIRGHVTKISEDGPIVDFKSVGVNTQIKKIKFTGNI